MQLAANPYPEGEFTRLKPVPRESMNAFRRVLTFPVLGAREQDELEALLGSVSRLGRLAGFSGLLYTAVSELIENAVRANLKRIFFERHQLDAASDGDYSRGIKQFKRRYKFICRSREYSRALVERGLLVSTEVDLTSKRLLIRVANNSTPLPREERRIREKLNHAMRAANFMEFADAHGDASEGQGLGFAIVVELLRHIGIDPGHFRIYTRGKRTFARIEIPLTEDHLPIRALTNG